MKIEIDCKPVDTGRGEKDPVVYQATEARLIAEPGEENGCWCQFLDFCGLFDIVEIDPDGTIRRQMEDSTLRLARIGEALERIVNAGAIAEVCLSGTGKAKYHVEARGFDRWHDDLAQALSLVADDVEVDEARAQAVIAAGR